jgi:hypothetical protein
MGRATFRGYRLPAGYGVTGLTSDGESLWLCCKREGRNLPDRLWRVDPDTGEILDRVTVRMGLFPVTRLAWDRGRLWARSDVTLSYAMVEIDPATGRRLGHVDVVRLVGKGGAFDVRDGILWHTSGRSLVKIDLAPAAEVLQRIGAGEWHQYAVAATDDVVYCRNAGVVVRAFDAGDGGLLETYTISDRVEDLAIDGGGRMWGVPIEKNAVVLVKLQRRSQ